jgi:hypothetical protein
MKAVSVPLRAAIRSHIPLLVASHLLLSLPAVRYILIRGCSELYSIPLFFILFFFSDSMLQLKLVLHATQQLFVYLFFFFFFFSFPSPQN